MADVFISYSSEDRERVRPLAEALRSRGLSVWWDRALGAGDDYTSVIERELVAAKAVIVVWTAASAASAFVRDEAGRARDQKRLVPVKLDATAPIPLGFGAFQVEDLSGWNGSPGAPQIGLLEEVLRAKIEGRDTDGAAVQARRQRTARRVRLISILTAIAVLLVIAASSVVLWNNAHKPPPVAQTDRLSQLLQLVAEGKLTGEQAATLAKLLQDQAFDAAQQTPASATAAAAPDAGITESEVAGLPKEDQQLALSAPQVRRSDMMSSARQTFGDAAGELLSLPDEQIRAAVLKTRVADSQEQGLSELFALAQKGGEAAAPLWRATGSLMMVRGDPRAIEALEKARDINPQDKSIWQLLSFGYAQKQQVRDAAGAAFVADGLDAAGRKNWSGAAVSYESARTLTKKPETLGFVLGQLGDVAAQTEQWAAAETNYRAALQVHTREKNVAALSLDSAKLARSHIKQGERREACDALRRAERNGAKPSEAEIKEACGDAQAAAPTAQAPSAQKAEPAPKTEAPATLKIRPDLRVLPRPTTTPTPTPQKQP